MRLTLSIMPHLYAVCHLHPDGHIPHWALIGDFVSLTRTEDELSVVCMQENVPEDIEADRGWRQIKAIGPFPLSMAGVHASLAVPLAEANISVLSIATYENDYVLVKEDHLSDAVDTLRRAGHTFRG